jgi:hypothetical protein
MELSLSDGRVIALQALEQRLVYEGLLEGVPRRDINAGYIAQAVARAGAHGAAVHLIEPVARALGSGRDEDGFGPMEALPSVVSAGRWRSRQPTSRGIGQDASTLVIVWFQDSFGAPQGAALLEALRGIPWDALAVDEWFE